MVDGSQLIDAVATSSPTGADDEPRVWPITATLIVSHIYLPAWAAILGDLVVLAIIVLCVRWLLHGVKQRNLIMAGHCEHCEYDLRATFEHGSDHCPECGSPLHDHPAKASYQPVSTA